MTGQGITIQIQGDILVPNSTWDERSKTYRAMALHLLENPKVRAFG
jgi:hypothetical protein